MSPPRGGYRPEYQATRRAAAKALTDDVKSNPCMDCGIQYPPHVMEFDHVRGVKRLAVAKMVQQAYSLDAIREEIAKCELVCANCHRERTFSRGQWHRAV